MLASMTSFTRMSDIGYGDIEFTLLSENALASFRRTFRDPSIDIRGDRMAGQERFCHDLDVFFDGGEDFCIHKRIIRSFRG